MVTTLSAIENFEELLHQHTSQSKETELERIVKTIHRVRTQNPEVYDTRGIANFLKERSTMLTALVDDYFVSSMSQRFPLIEPDMFKLQRHLTIEKHGDKWKVIQDDVKEPSEERTRNKRDYSGRKKKETSGQSTKAAPVQREIDIALFAYTPLFQSDRTASVGGMKTTQRHPGYSYTSTSTMKVSATLPGDIGPSLYTAYGEALSHYYSILAQMCTQPVARDLLHAEKKIATPEVGAIWIPLAESLSISVTEKVQQKRNYDPAMIISTRGHRFLVRTWMVDDEKPIDAYLAKYARPGKK